MNQSFKPRTVDHNIGCFPAHEQAKVIRVGVRSGHPHLFQLKKKIEDVLFDIGIEPDSRVYQPRITDCHVQRSIALNSSSISQTSPDSRNCLI